MSASATRRSVGEGAIILGSRQLLVMPTILLADDSTAIWRVVELTFADEGVRVISVQNGERAIAQIEADPPDIVLADVAMPRADGYDVASYVKQSPSLRHIPVLLLTGAFERIDEEKARATGCDGVLVQPFEPLCGLPICRSSKRVRARPTVPLCSHC